jgi:hypothetical protein
MKIPIRIRRSIFAMAAMAAIALSTSAIASAQYTFVKVKVPISFAKYPNLTGISNNNEISGNFEEQSEGRLRNVGFLRSNAKPATWTYLIDPAGDGIFTYASGVNSIGTVVGWYQVSKGVVDGMVYNGGTYGTFNVEGCKWSYVSAVNDKGAITGYCYENGAFTSWLNTDSVTTFSIPGAVNTFAQGINSIDQVVGYWDTGNPNTSQGFLRVFHGEVYPINFPGAVTTFVNGISDINSSDVGWVCGSFIDASNNGHGFLYSNGVYTQIDVPGATATGISGVNKNGWFVGGYTDAQGKSVLFYAKPSAGASVVVDEE